MGELRQRGRVWWIRYYRNGQRFEQSSGSTKKEDATRLLRIKEGAIAKGAPLPPKVDKVRFQDLADDLLNDYTNNQHRSVDNVRALVTKHLEPWFGGARMAFVTATDVRAYVAHRLEQDAAPATINRELAALKRMYSLAVKAGVLHERPHIALLEEHNVRQGFFEREAFEAVRDHLPADLRPLVTFAYYTGWRIDSEVASLQWHQVDRQAGTVYLAPGTTKNGEARTIYYAQLADLKAVLDAQWAHHEALKGQGQIQPYVFPRTVGRTKGQRTRSFRKAWITACRAAGCPGRVPHDLRRTAVRNLERAGVPRAIAMATTGHKTESVYRRYDIVSDADLQLAATRLQTYHAAG